MASKIEFTYNGQTKQAYKEQDLILWPLDDGPWIVLHEKTAMMVHKDKSWKMKRDALAYARALIDYEEDGKKIIWDCSTYQTFYQVNDEAFIVRAWNKVKDM